jgi:hypothetical protein
MSNLYIRAIETREDINKVISDEFTPGLISYLGFNKRVKFEMKRMKRISKRNKPNDIINVKLNNRFINCKITNIVIDEITGWVSWIELEKVSTSEFTNKKVPLVFNTKSNENGLKVLLTEIDIGGKYNELPEYIIVNLEDINQKKLFTISHLNVGPNLKVMNKQDDIIAYI